MNKILLTVLILLPSASYAAPSYLDYGSVSCTSLANLAEETMSNWQSGATVKEMLTNSTIYGNELYKKSGIKLKDAELHTYAMASAAMKEPIRKSAFYKSYVASKFSVDYDFMCGLKQDGAMYGLSSSVNSYAMQQNECRDLEKYASGFMESRQEGVPIGSLLKLNQEVYEDQALKESYDKNRANEIYVQTNSIILNAYSKTIGSNDFEKDKSTVEFGESYYLGCMAK